MAKTTNSKPTTMEELLASRSAQGKLLSLYRGQQVDGEVVAITNSEITLDLGTKSEGVLQKKEVKDDLKIGDKLKAYVQLPENENGQVILSASPQTRTPLRRDSSRSDWSKFAQAQANQSKLQGAVTEVNKGGLIVETGGVRGFLPNSQIGFELLSKSQGGMETLIGQTLTLTVIEIDQANNKLIFSQRGQISDEIKQKLSGFEKGQKVQGKIVAILPFGLVVSVRGIEGFVFISDVSWEKVEDLHAQFHQGQQIQVLVTGLDEELGRLNLSIKHLKEDPFAKLAEIYPADEVVKGEITAVNEAGVIVKLDGIEGLLPSAKMSPDISYEVGKSVTLLVDSVDIQRRRVNLTPFVTSTKRLIYK